MAELLHPEATGYVRAPGAVRSPVRQPLPHCRKERRVRGLPGRTVLACNAAHYLEGSHRRIKARWIGKQSSRFDQIWLTFHEQGLPEKF